MSTTVLMCPVCQGAVSRNGIASKCPLCKYDFSAAKGISISPQEAKKRMESGKIMILDVRQPSEYDFSHLENAKLIPLAQLPQRFKEINKKDEIIVYCQRGMNSHHAAAFLKQKGYNAAFIEGGLEKWNMTVGM